MLRSRRTHRSRVALAIVACALWICGVEVLPNLHLAFHDSSTHTHAADGMVVTVSLNTQTHRHANGEVHTDHAEPRHGEAKKRTARLSIDEPADQHAANGLSHHAAFLHQPAPPLTEPLPIDRRALWIAVSIEQSFTAAETTSPRARGPPAV